MAATSLGLLKLKYRLLCPSNGSGIRDYEKLSQIPKQILCDTCGETHEVTPDDIEYFFELSEKAAHVGG